MNKAIKAILEAAALKKIKPVESDDNVQGKKEEVPAGGKTLTGQQHNEIDVKPMVRPLREAQLRLTGATSTRSEIAPGKHVVATFGRMSVPTTGHESLVNYVKQLAKVFAGEPHVYLSYSQDNKKNPLSYDHKHRIVRDAFGDVVKHIPREHANLIGVAKYLNGKADHLHMVVGSDRAVETKKKLEQYNGKDYHFKSINVHSIGRDPDAEGVEGMSATKMRAAAAAGDHKTFKAGLPAALHHKSHEIMKAVSGKKTIGEQVADTLLDESLSAQQRQKRAIQFRRIKNRVKLGRDRAIRRRAPKSALVRRSRRLAIKFMRARISRGVDYSKLSYAGRAQIDQRLKKRKKSIKRVAQRLLPKVIRAESKRKLGGRFAGIGGKSGSNRAMAEENLFQLIESMVGFVTEDYDYELTAGEFKNLEEKATANDLPVDILESVFRRGLSAWALDEGTELQFQSYAFNRVNSFLAGGVAWEMDFDLLEDVLFESDGDDDEDDDLFESEEALASETSLTVSGKQQREIIAKLGLRGVHRSKSRPGTPSKSQIIHKIINEAKESVNGWLAKNEGHKDYSMALDHAKKNGLHDQRFIDKKKAELTKGKKLNEEEELAEAPLEGETRRCDMPQLTDFDAFSKDLSDCGHSMKSETRETKHLEPTQKHFNQEKVDKIVADGAHKTGKPIIVSQDDKITDGHHRWKAADQEGDKIATKKVSLKLDDLLDFVKGKPYVEKKNLDENRDPTVFKRSDPTVLAGLRWQAEQHKKTAMRHEVGTKSHHKVMESHHDSMHEYYVKKGHMNLADKAADKAEDHAEKASNAKT